MRIVVDRNLTPAWVGFLTTHGIEAQHWSSVGSPSSPDEVVMSWARTNDHVVFTHDLDFGALLAIAGSGGPSVIQVRAQDVLPDAIGRRVLEVLHTHAPEIERRARRARRRKFEGSRVARPLAELIAGRPPSAGARCYSGAPM